VLGGGGGGAVCTHKILLWRCSKGELSGQDMGARRGTREIHSGFWGGGGNVNEIYRFDALSTDGRIIFKCILKKTYGRV
jgi:hypothetical protein